MRIAIMGAGAVGGYFGAMLARAGHDVVFIARGAQLQALQTAGLAIVDDDDRKTTVAPVTATNEPAQAGAVDAVLFCVKLYDTIAAARACVPLLGPETFVLTLQNGVESVDMLSEVLGAERVLGGATYIVASLESPGVVRRTGRWARIEFAEPHGGRSERALGFEQAARDAGIDVELCEDLRALLWGKFLLLSATSATTALTRQTIGVIRQDPVMARVAESCIRETAAVARALGVELDPGAQTSALERFFTDISPDAKASQLVDLERGKRLELEHLSGAIHRLGEPLGVPTPVHSTVYAALRPFVAGRPAGPTGSA